MATKLVLLPAELQAEIERRLNGLSVCVQHETTGLQATANDGEIEAIAKLSMPDGPLCPDDFDHLAHQVLVSFALQKYWRSSKKRA